MYGENLRKARKNAKMTLVQVAMKMNTTHATISRYENEVLKIDAQTLAKFCELYNVSADYILDLPKDMPYPENDKE